MKLLLDTQLLLLAAIAPERLSRTAARLIADTETALIFSAVSVWEVAIKRQLGRADFDVEPATFRRSLIDNGYTELPLNSQHAIALSTAPVLHKDPFDRILIAQAQAEGFTLVTADRMIAAYPGPIRKV